ncbi:Nephrocystin-3 [Colletotrichum tanaceti]|uniref:Nephrocystin-3 n=1 Tax=Colletotrichum tanaceti TaxID=1306861 RepID=A0A4U6X1W3_9PEZI|nr:Nephrocystin-3 [Colletotrichum tanaceti]TKW49135.1 Nephrocystin-3 [Colletotrichum tanaceti]
MDRQSHFGSTTGHVAFPGAHVETGGTLNVTVSSTRPLPITARPDFVFPFEQNKDFIDRPDIVARLDALLPPAAGYQSAALWGLGGSGKTQIALEFAYSRFHQTKCAVYWVHADNEATFTQDYEALARKAGLENEKKGKDLLHAVRGWIEAQPRWLLVIDNADDISLFGVGSDTASTRGNRTTAEETCLYDYIPRGPVGTVLWTTRDERLVGSLVGVRQGVQVGRMTAGEATALFESTRGNDVVDDEKGSVSELLTKLDHLPLAVSQAAAYIRRLSMPVAQYLSKLEEMKKRWKVLREAQHDRHRRSTVPNSILQTWSISMDHIKKKDPTAYYLFLTLAYVHNENIPETLVHAAAKSCRAIIGQSTSNPSSSAESDDGSDDEDDAVATAVARLREFSFLSARKPQNVGKTYEMHGLVQDAARYALSRKSRRGEAARFSKTALLLVAALFPSEDAWKESDPWLPHALQSSEWAEVCEADADPEIAALLGRVSLYLTRRGRDNEGLLTIRKAFLLRRAALGATHPTTLSTMYSLALLYSGQQRRDEAEEIALEAVKICQQALGKRHPETLIAMTGLGRLFYLHNKLNDGEEILVEVLKPKNLLQSLEETNPDTIQVQAMVEIAAIHHRQGKISTAVQIMVKLLRFQKEWLGKNIFETMRIMMNLAEIYSAQKGFQEAEWMMEKILELEIETSGGRGLRTSAAMHHLAQIYNAQGKYQDAERILVEGLKLQEHVVGNKHRSNVWLKKTLSDTYTAQEKHHDAEHHLAEALELHEDIVGKKDKDIVWLRRDLYKVCVAQRKHSDAEHHLVEALKLNEHLFGKEDDSNIWFRQELAKTHT